MREGSLLSVKDPYGPVFRKCEGSPVPCLLAGMLIYEPLLGGSILPAPFKNSPLGPG